MPRDIAGFKVHSLREVLNMPNTPQATIVGKLIYQKGKTVLVGKPKLGKSWLAIKIGICASDGQELLGFQIKQAPVLYMEFDRRYLRDTIGQLTDKPNDNMSFCKVSGIALNEAKGLQFLDEIVKELEPRLVIIDHKSACFSGKENEDEPNRRWISNLDIIANKYDVSFLIICQAPKGWRGDIVDLPIGSRILTAWADTIISLQPSGEGFRKLEVRSNYGEVEPVVYNKEFQIAPEELLEETKLSKALGYMRSLWEQVPNPTERVEQVAKLVPCGKNTAWNAYREIKREKAAEELATLEAKDIQTK